MRHSKFDLAQVAAAFSLPLALVAVAGWFAWSEAWERAEGELFRTADGAAEYAQRMVSSALLAGRLTNSLLAGAADAEIRANEVAFHSRLAQIMPDLPGAIAIVVSDGEGDVLLMSTEFPAPRASVADREWVRALRAPDAPPLYIGPLTVSRVQGRLFFSVSIPRRGSGNARPPGTYDGLINVSLDPHVVAAGLATTTHEPTDVIALVRSDGEILSTTRGLRPDLPAIPPESRLRAAIAAGETRGMYEGRALGLREGIPTGRGLSIAFRQVGVLPAYVTVSRTPGAIIAPWLRTMAGLLAVGLPASLALGLLSLTAVRRRNALFVSEAELAASFDSAATGTALVDGATGRILKANRRLGEIAGRAAEELRGLTLDELLERGGGDGGEAGGAEPGEASAGLDRLRRPDGSVRWIECATAPVILTPDASPALVIASLHDISERKESQERQALLAREVDHRAKNVLAIVQAVIRLARDPAAAAFADKIEGRIRALARAHELLARDRWQGADLVDLIRDELAPYQDGARVTISGAAVRIAPGAVQPLSMALHELATNALKHGALGRPEGGLTVAWRPAGSEGRLELLWEEQAAGAAGAEPTRRGAGLRILRGSIEQFGGTVALDWRAEGLRCRIELPAEALAEGHGPGAAEPGVAREGGPRDGAGALAGARVLLVEDEVLLAMDLKATLEDLGCTVVGPASNLDAARRLVGQEEGRLDAALLDLNLRGATTLELARTLDAAGVACLFVTGYSELPEPDGRDWPLLRKPVSRQDVSTALQTLLGPAPEKGAAPKWGVSPEKSVDFAALDRVASEPRPAAPHD